MIGQVKNIDDLTPQDIALSARLAFDAHHDISRCPFEFGTEASDRWRKAFIAIELQEEMA